MSARVSKIVLFALMMFSAPIHAAMCSVESSQIQFGKINPLQPDSLQTIGSIVLLCDAEVSWARVRISAGNSMGFGHREMVSGEYRLSYNLFQDNNHENVFGDDSPGAPGIELSLSSPGQATNIPVFAAIEPGQSFNAGEYTDEILVMIDF